jgi:hypothetical protein
MRSNSLALLLFWSTALADPPAARHSALSPPRGFPSAAAACGAGNRCLWPKTDDTLHWTTAAGADVNLSASSGSSLSAALFDGTYTHHIYVGNPSPGVWLHIDPGDSSPYTHFYGTYQSFAVNGGSVPNDNVLRLGPNCAVGGGPFEIGKMSACFEMESFYRPDSIGNPNYWQTETHLEICDENGVCTRAYSFLGPRTGLPSLYFNGGAIAMGIGPDLNAPSALTIDATTTRINSPLGSAGHLTLLLDDGDHTTSAAAADGNGNFSSTIWGSTGVLILNATNVLRLENNGNAGIDVHGSDTVIYQPDDHNQFLQVDGNGLYSYVGSIPKLLIQASSTYTTQTLRPAADSSTHLARPAGAGSTRTSVGRRRIKRRAIPITTPR